MIAGSAAILQHHFNALGDVLGLRAAAPSKPSLERLLDMLPDRRRHVGIWKIADDAG
jgi:hypothetical protein